MCIGGDRGHLGDGDGSGLGLHWRLMGMGEAVRGSEMKFSVLSYSCSF